MNILSFRDLATEQASEGSSALETWYRSIQDTPISSLSIGDLCRAIRQELYLSHVIPVALQHLQSDPLSGDLYEGELAFAIARVPKNFWRLEPDLVTQAKNLLVTQNYNAFDDDLREEIDKEIERFLEQN